MRFVSSLRPYHMIVTNVHGPPVPLYLLGARMLDFHPLLPLFANQGLAIAMMSYDGRVHVGLNADWDAVRDLEVLADAFDASLAELRDAAERRPAARRGRGAALGIAAMPTPPDVGALRPGLHAPEHAGPDHALGASAEACGAAGLLPGRRHSRLHEAAV